MISSGMAGTPMMGGTAVGSAMISGMVGITVHLVATEFKRPW
jgi:hypothetical protein